MSTRSIRVTSESVDKTMELGRRIGAALGPGDVVALAGDLGAGKTVLAKGLAAGLGYPWPQEVTSPTFVLMQRYVVEEDRLVICHVDAYRVQSGWDLVETGGDELFSQNTVSLVEWPERVADALDMPHLYVEIEAGGGEQRSLAIHSAAGFPEDRLTALAESLRSDAATD